MIKSIFITAWATGFAWLLLNVENMSTSQHMPRHSEILFWSEYLADVTGIYAHMMQLGFDGTIFKRAMA